MKLRRYLLLPMLDDLEAEITYLLIRDREPRVVVESPLTPGGPRRGFSALSGTTSRADSYGRMTSMIPVRSLCRRSLQMGDGTL